jgi:hypothetical protein
VMYPRIPPSGHARPGQARPGQARPGQARPIASSTLHQHTALTNQTGCCCPALLQDDTVALCLTPQGYHNIRPGTDIFNNVNLGFWEYILPGEACCLLPGPAASPTAE